MNNRTACNPPPVESLRLKRAEINYLRDVLDEHDIRSLTLSELDAIAPQPQPSMRWSRLLLGSQLGKDLAQTLIDALVDSIPRASYRRVNDIVFRASIAADPVAVLRKAIAGERPLARKRRRVHR